MPSTHRFQSRFFQTLQAKFYQFQDAVQLHWRQLKVATIWGIQLSLYSPHVALQAGRWSRKALQQQVEKGARSLSITLGLEAPVASDQPIQNILAALDVHRLSALAPIEQAPQSLELSVSAEQFQLSIRPAATRKLSFAEKCGKLWQKWRGASQPTQDSAIAPLSSDLVRSPTLTIQGVASSLCHRRLVLVTSGNQVLDILTLEQQHLLHQRIIFKIAVALSEQRRLGAALVSLPSQTSPIALLKGVWKQIQQSARAVFLLPAAVIARLPGSANSSSPALIPHSLMVQIAPRLKSLRGAIVVAISAIALAPFTLALPARAATAPALPQPLPAAPFAAEWIVDPARTRKQWLKGIGLFGQSKPIQGKIRLVPDKAPAALSSEPFQAAIADWAYRFSQTAPSTGSPPIDVDAAFMGYHLHPLERLLVVLDQIMVWLETQILWLWQQGKVLMGRLSP